MTAAPLDGRVVVVGVEQAPAARALGSRGAIVVVVGADPDAVGALVRDVAGGGARAAGFLGDPSTPDGADALTEMIGELFQPDDSSGRR
jgi:hypothetical protein